MHGESIPINEGLEEHRIDLGRRLCICAGRSVRRYSTLPEEKLVRKSGGTGRGRDRLAG